VQARPRKPPLSTLGTTSAADSGRSGPCYHPRREERRGKGVPLAHGGGAPLLPSPQNVESVAFFQFAPEMVFAAVQK
jgi:hypothetical protein